MRRRRLGGRGRLEGQVFSVETRRGVFCVGSLLADGPGRDRSGTFDRVLVERVDQDDQQVIADHETVRFSGCPATLERLCLCCETGRNVDPAKYLISAGSRSSSSTISTPSPLPRVSMPTASS